MIERFILLVQTKELISINYKQHKQLKTIEINGAWPDNYDEENMH